MELRKYQLKTIDEVLQATDCGHCNILIEAACGAGKTVMALKIAKILNEKFGYKTGWCAMRQYLLDQACAENENIGLKDVSYFTIFSSNVPKIDLLITDEGHHSAANSAIGVVQKSKPLIHIGLTATPFRTDKMHLCFSKSINVASIGSLVDQGYLSQFDQYNFNLSWTPKNIADIYLNDIGRWGKSIIFFQTKKECDTCASLIRNAARCQVVWYGSDHNQQIAEFINNDLDVLINIEMLTEGFNCCDLATVFVRPASKGPTIQMAGRVLRKFDNKIAQIVQNNETKWQFTETASQRCKFVLDSYGKWNSIIHTDMIRLMSRKMVAAISRS